MRYEILKMIMENEAFHFFRVIRMLKIQDDTPRKPSSNGYVY